MMNKKEFTPTYLMIKQHTITGLKYFCKTCKKDPLKYKGSGKYWISHITYHGKQYVKTIWYRLFTDKEECVNYALSLSEIFDITNSDLWANLKPENSLDGGVFGFKNEKASERMKQNNPMTILRINSGSFKIGRTYTASETHRKNQSISKIADKNPNFRNKSASNHLNKSVHTCSVCGISTNKGNISRWHNSKCKKIWKL